MATAKKITELTAAESVNLTDLIFVGDPVTGELQKATTQQLTDLLQPLGFYCSAGMDLAAGTVVFLLNGFAYAYNPSLEDLAGMVAGIVKNTVLETEDVFIQTCGIFQSDEIDLESDKRYFVGPSGTLIQDATGQTIIQQIGVSVSATQLVMNFYTEPQTADTYTPFELVENTDQITLPPGMYDKIIVEDVSGTLIKIGTTAGGEEILEQVAINENGFYSYDYMMKFLTDTVVYITGVTASAIIKVRKS